MAGGIDLQQEVARLEVKLAETRELIKANRRDIELLTSIVRQVENQLWQIEKK